ncbi:MAG: histidinol-phosphate transaminase [Bacteroidales bacterium]
MNELVSLINPAIRKLSPYKSARSEVSDANYLLLDANESPYGAMNRYPDPLQKELKQQICQWKGVREDQIFLGNGSDEAIDLLMRIFTRPGSSDEVLVPEPTYGMYKVTAAIQQIAYRTVLLPADFQLRPEKLVEAINEQTRIIMLCTPNNPTGNTIPVGAIEAILATFRGIVVVDEAYIDFANTPSMLQKLDEYPNLVVVQTFSKALGMAGARLGMCFANPIVIEQLNKIKPPYNVNVLTQTYALEQLQQESVNRSRIRSILSERDVLATALEELSVVEQVFPSEANFLLVRFADAQDVYQFLLNNRIVVRDRSNEPNCEGCLRISIGKPQENHQLVAALKRYEEVNLGKPIKI